MKSVSKNANASALPLSKACRSKCSAPAFTYAAATTLPVSKDAAVTTLPVYKNAAVTIPPVSKDAAATTLPVSTYAAATTLPMFKYDAATSLPVSKYAAVFGHQQRASHVLLAVPDPDVSLHLDGLGIEEELGQRRRV